MTEHLADRDRICDLRDHVPPSSAPWAAQDADSGDQVDVWQAVVSPVGDDGYPRPIRDKLTEVIDHGDRANH